jgi:hypothetical protein
MRLNLLTLNLEGKRFVFEVVLDSRDNEFIIVDWSDECDKELAFRKEMIAEQLIIIARENTETSYGEIQNICHKLMNCRVTVI